MKFIPVALFSLFTITGASAEMVIHTKDGRTLRVQVESSDITSIEFASQNAQSSAQIPSGRWVGTFRNSLGDSGATTLNIVVNGNAITGTIDGDQIQDTQWDGKTLRFSLQSRATQTNYKYEFQLGSDKKGKLTYQATSPTRSYTGYVNDYVRQ